MDPSRNKYVFIRDVARIKFSPVVLSLNRLAGNVEGTNSEEEPAMVHWRTVGKIAQLYPFPLLKKPVHAFYLKITG